MINPEIKFIESPDVDIETLDLKSGYPFMVFVEVMIGNKGEEGYEIFGFEFCNAEWIVEELKNTNYFIGKHRIMVEAINKEIIETVLTLLLEEVTFESWADFAQKFSHYGHWEYENYKVHC